MHNFTIIIKPYKRENCVLDDMRRIYSGNTCIVAKNNKFGGLYLHKNAKIVKGKFHHVAGSNSYPILCAKTKEVHIEVTNFHSPPNVITDQCVKQGIIQVLTN